MDIDKLFKDKIYEGQAPVEDSLWSDIEAKLNTPSANASPTQTAGAKSFISQTWQAMTIGAKVVTSVVAVALVSTAVVLLVNGSDNVSSNGSDEHSNGQEQISQILEDTTHTAPDNINKEETISKENTSKDVDFEPYYDDDITLNNIDETYKPTPPSKIENNTSSSSNINPKKIKNDTASNKINPVSHIDTNANVDIKIPNYITPNADGINDCFNIKNIDKYPDNTLIIKDRKGKIVFRQRHYNGSFCGENCVVGTYFYVLTVRKGSHVQQFTGVIEVLR